MLAASSPKEILMKNLRSLVLAVLFAGPFSAYGHEIIPEYWCTDARQTPKIIDQFNFDGDKLRDLIKRCGEVDKSNDHWHAVAGAIFYYCNFELHENGYGELPVLPYVTGPESFNNREHHSIYTIDQGVVGSCVVCVPVESELIRSP